MLEQSDNINKRAIAYRILAGEAVITTFMALLFWVVSGGVAAYSALLGGFAYILPNIVFVAFAFKYSAAESAQMALGALFVGEGIKLVATAILFALCFILVQPISIGALFVTFVVMVFVNLAGIALIMK